MVYIVLLLAIVAVVRGLSHYTVDHVKGASVGDMLLIMYTTVDMDRTELLLQACTTDNDYGIHDNCDDTIQLSSGVYRIPTSSIDGELVYITIKDPYTIVYLVRISARMLRYDILIEPTHRDRIPLLICIGNKHKIC